LKRTPITFLQEAEGLHTGHNGNKRNYRRHEGC
jgi:hypothetical protein